MLLGLNVPGSLDNVDGSRRQDIQRRCGQLTRDIQCPTWLAVTEPLAVVTRCCQYDDGTANRWSMRQSSAYRVGIRRCRLQLG